MLLLVYMNIQHQPEYGYDTYVYCRYRKLCGWKFKPCVSVYRIYYYNNYVYYITINALINICILLLILHSGQVRLHYLHTRNRLCLSQYPTYWANVLCAAVQAHYMVIVSIIKEVYTFESDITSCACDSKNMQ